MINSADITESPPDQARHFLRLSDPLAEYQNTVTFPELFQNRKTTGEPCPGQCTDFLSLPGQHQIGAGRFLRIHVRFFRDPHHSSDKGLFLSLPELFQLRMCPQQRNERLSDPESELPVLGQFVRVKRRRYLAHSEGRNDTFIDGGIKAVLVDLSAQGAEQDFIIRCTERCS